MHGPHVHVHEGPSFVNTSLNYNISSLDNSVPPYTIENYFVGFLSSRSPSRFLIIYCNRSDRACGACECLWSKQSWLVLPKTHTVFNNYKCYPKPNNSPQIFLYFTVYTICKQSWTSVTQNPHSLKNYNMQRRLSCKIHRATLGFV